MGLVTGLHYMKESRAYASVGPYQRTKPKIYLSLLHHIRRQPKCLQLPMWVVCRRQRACKRLAMSSVCWRKYDRWRDYTKIVRCRRWLLLSIPSSKCIRFFVHSCKSTSMMRWRISSHMAKRCCATPKHTLEVDTSSLCMRLLGVCYVS